MPSRGKQRHGWTLIACIGYGGEAPLHVYKGKGWEWEEGDE